MHVESAYNFTRCFLALKWRVYLRCVLHEVSLVDHLAPSKTETELALVGESSGQEGSRGDSNMDGYELRRRVPPR